MNNKLRAELARKCETELVVPVEEGLTCREWLWFPDVSPQELEHWWSELENVETFWNAQGRATWPGSFTCVDEDNQLSELWEHAWNDGAYRARIEFNGQMDSSGPSSYLRKADGTVLLHKGALHLLEADLAGIDE